MSLILVSLVELKKMIHHFEEREAKMLVERTKLEQDFGLRRAKLKELYLQKESKCSSVKRRRMG